MKEFVFLLCCGDIIVYVFYGKGSIIFIDEGVVLVEVYQVRERGVIFDVVNGCSYFLMNMVCWVIVNGFFLDIISSVFLIIIKFVWFVYVLLWILLKYLVFGVVFIDVINVCIYILVVLLGMVVEIGMLVLGYLLILLFLN